MASPVTKELELLYKYAQGSKFILETGGGGLSTEYLARAARESGAYMATIELDEEAAKISSVPGVDVKVGWSIAWEDLVQPDDPRFKWLYRAYRNSYKGPDKEIIEAGDEGKEIMEKRAPTNMIRKICKEQGRGPDFFFCDTGSYCGLSEWDIAKEIMPVDSIFACHDIYYPEDVKGYRAVLEIRKSDQWEVLEQTYSYQGMIIAKRTRRD